MAEDKRGNFLLGLVKFYRSFLSDTVNSIKILGELQKNYPNEYKELVQIQKDPSNLLTLSEKMKDEDRKILIDMFIRASTISKKLMLVYELTLEEKNKLIEEIEFFAKSMDTNIGLLSKK